MANPKNVLLEILFIGKDGTIDARVFPVSFELKEIWKMHKYEIKKFNRFENFIELTKLIDDFFKTKFEELKNFELYKINIINSNYHIDLNFFYIDVNASYKQNNYKLLNVTILVQQ